MNLIIAVILSAGMIYLPLTDKSELETALKNGTAYILPPKYFLISKFLQKLFWFSILFGFIYYIFEFVDYALELAETCETIFGLNSILFKDIICMPLVILYLLYVFMIDYKKFKKRKQPPPLIVKPYLFSERIVYTYKKNEETNFLVSFSSILIIIFFIFTNSNLPKVAKDLIQLDIAQANEYYQQECLAKKNKP